MDKGFGGVRVIQGRESFTILQRIAKSEKTAVEDCVNSYGNLIWALAKKFTASPKEAEESAIKIFNDIWKCAALYDSAKCTEEKYVLKVALRHLFNKSTR
jgi:hypothetical protein